MTVDSQGRASDLWLSLLRKRLAPAEYDSVAQIRKELTQEEREWIALVERQSTTWDAMIPALTRPYAPVPPPRAVRIVLGNRGADDAFTHDAVTMGFDLDALVRNYGSASLPVNQDRIDRFFRHEFTHLMQKAWLRQHPWSDSSMLGQALLDIWAEGLGNYHSLSSRWVDSGRPTPLGQATLDSLNPRFVANLGILACADSAAARPLLRTLSSGPFAKKWGAVTPALWLATESDSLRAIRELVHAGPNGTWTLARRHLPDSLQAQLESAHRRQCDKASDSRMR